MRRLVAFYVDEHDHVLPHSAFRGQTPDEMYFGMGNAMPAELTSRAAAARQARLEAQPISVVRDVSVDQRGGVTAHDTVAFGSPM